MKPSLNPLDTVQKTIAARVIMGEAEMTACVLWTAHTHIYTYFRLSPLLFVTSGDPGCGKSTLLHTMMDMCPQGQVVGKASEAALARLKKNFGDIAIALDQQDNTLMKDHGQLIDTLCASREKDKQVLTSELDPDGNWITVFRDLFFPIAVGKIGDIPDLALGDRCLNIRLHPATEAESNQLYRNSPGRVSPDVKQVLSEWLVPLGPSLGRSLPDLPQGLYNRARDKWHPLLAIADAAGGQWPEKARTAAVEMDVEKEKEEEPKQVVLLRALVDIVGPHWKHDNIFVHLVRDALIERGYQPASKYWPSNHLSKVGVKSVPIYIPGMKLARGYRIAQIREAAERYLPKEEE